MVSKSLEGGCHCGQVRYSIQGTPMRSSLCHCRDCQRHAGAPIVAWTLVPLDIVVIHGDTKVYASSVDGRRYFCPNCGTGLFYRNDKVFLGQIDIQLATLDFPDDAPSPDTQIQTAERLAWMTRLNDIRAFDRYPGMAPDHEREDGTSD